MWCESVSVGVQCQQRLPPGLNTIKRHTQSKDFGVYSKITARASDSDDDGDRDI